MAKPKGPLSDQLPKTTRVWSSKHAESLPQVPLVPADNVFQPPAEQAQAYDKETFLFVRQRMIDAGESGETSQKYSCPTAMKAFAGIQTQVSEEAILSGKPSKKLSTNSVCSTNDALSETSEDHDASSSVGELPLVEGLAGGQGTLRASAPEFVPHAAASVPDLMENVSPQILSSTPVSPWGWASGSNISDAGFFHRALKSHAEMPIMKNVFSEVDSQAYLEWRHYCGLTMTLRNDPPRGFRDWDAHRCSIAELFATAKPGQLFDCGEN